MAYTARVRNRPRNEIQYTVVPRSELLSLHRFVSEDEARRVREGQEERERLKQQSEERVKNWPNTIEAMRLKKEAERKQRLNEEEAVRKKKDEEDAHAQAEARREAIERANLILYEQDDRVKTFNSKMLLSHVLEERQKQLEMKEKLKEMERNREREFSVTLHEQLRVAAEEETKQQEARRAAALKVRDMQQSQLGDAKQKFRRQRDEKRKEGEAIRYTAERAVLQELEEDKVRKLRARDLAEEYSKANLELEKTRAEQARIEEAENLKIQKFAQLKEEQMLERKRRADEKFKMDMERRHKMIERQAGHLQQIHSQQEERVLRQAQEEEIKHENKVSEDRRRRIQVWNDIQESRAQQNEMRARKKRMDADEEAAFRDQWQSTANVLLQEEAAARHDARGKAKRLQEFQLMQHRERASRKDMDKAEEKLEGQLMKKAVEEEETMFKKYVDNVMTEYAAKGLDMGALRSIRKRHEPL